MRFNSSAISKFNITVFLFSSVTVQTTDLQKRHPRQKHTPPTQNTTNPPKKNIKPSKKPQQFCNDKKRFFSVGMSVLVRIDIALIIYCKKGTNLKSNIIGPFEIRKFVQIKNGKNSKDKRYHTKVELIIPQELKIKGVFDINDLRTYKESPLIRLITEKDYEKQILAREILVERFSD